MEIKFYGAFVLNHRVVLHAIDATPARWRGDAGSSPLDRARTAASLPRNEHPTHWLISTQVSHDAMRLQWRALDMGAADGAPCGFAALDAVDSVRVRHRKGVPVICVKEPGRKLFLELAPESDLSAATWASTLTHLVRLARESSAFS